MTAFPHLQSPQLSFSRDGHTLIELEGDALSLVDADTGTVARIAFTDARAAVGFADQIWVAHGRAPQLSRIARDGRAIGAPVPIADAAHAVLLAAPVGPAAAAWTARPRQIWIEEGGVLAPQAAQTAEIAIPLTGRRWVTATGARIVAPSGLACELAAGTRVLGGAVIHDGTDAALLVARGSGREIVVIGIANCRPKSRQAIAAAPARVAVRRGLVAIRVEPRRLALLDLRSGRVLGEVASRDDILDFALDPDGQRIALRGALLEVLRVGEAIGRRIGVQVVEEPELRDEPPPPLALPAAVTDVAPSVPVPRPLDLRALAPVRHVEAMPRAEALVEIDREIRNVALRTLLAIARAWDTRRLGYGNEGRHPYEHEVAALLGMNQGFASEHLAAAEAHLAAHDAELASRAERRGRASPIGALAAELGLSSVAVDLLLAVAAPSLWSEAARLYGVLANDPHRAVVDEALLHQIFAGRIDRHDLAAELDARAPLIQLGVIIAAAGASRPFAGLEVDPIVLARLRQTPPDLAGIVVRSSDRALEELALAPNLVTDVVAAVARAAMPARIVVRGRAGSGRRTLVAALADEAGRALGVIDVATLPRAQRGAALQAALRRAHLAGLLPFVIGIEDVALVETEARDVLVEVLRAHPGPLAVRLPPGATAPLDPGHVAIELPVLEEGQRLAVWRTALADAGLSVADPAALAARYRIGPGAIHRAIGTVLDRGDGAGDATAPLEAFIQQTRDGRLGAYARRVERLARWETLVLPSDIFDSLHELVARVRHRRTVFETWGMDEALATARGLTALFSGPPGTGKTLVAGAIARELGLDLYQVDLSKVMSKWIGETERHLGAIFDAAEDGQVVLLFDEADSLFAKRTEVRSSNDRYANLEVNYLLQRLDSFEGIAILTTNAVRSIDPALKRRLSFQLSFPFPDEETREKLWRAHLPARLPIRGELALDRLAHKYQLSGGYIRNACLRAAFLAARDGAALTQLHLERAVALEFAELGKLSSGGAID